MSRKIVALFVSVVMCLGLALVVACEKKQEAAAPAPAAEAPAAPAEAPAAPTAEAPAAPAAEAPATK